MKHFKLTFCFFVIIFIMPGLINAQNVGDKLPPLSFTEQIAGVSDQIGTWGDGKVYLIEFWGTWCAPCIPLLPKLTKLQKDYKDKGLVVIGYSWEEPKKLKKFANEYKDKIGYILVNDTEKKTIDFLNEKGALQGMPYTFLIGKDGKIAWHGSPKKAGLAIKLYFANKPINIDDGIGLENN